MTGAPKRTKAEAGRLGGMTTAHRYGRAHMSAIGALGAEANLAANGPAQLERARFEAKRQRYAAQAKTRRGNDGLSNQTKETK